MFDGDPESVQAIVVGVDIYDACTTWNLKGPTQDAIRTADWLCDQGVPVENIALFLSPSSWRTQLVQDWLVSKPGFKERHATSHNFANYINEDLPGITATALLLHWGGHGVVGDGADKQYLYTADATKTVPHSVCAQALLDAFRAPHFGNLTQQVFVFDVCANQEENISFYDPAPVQAGLAQPRKRIASISQCQMYGASLGNRATNRIGTGREGGLFSKSLFEELRNRPRPNMRQFIDAFAALKQNRELGDLHRQAPMIVEPGWYPSGQPSGHWTSQAQQLLARIREIDPPHARLRRLYRQSQPLIELRFMEDDVEAWMRDLVDTRPRLPQGYPSPLVEFAERLGRELSLPDLQEWARAQCKPGYYPALKAALDREERRANRLTANLFIEVKTENAREFYWWLEGSGLAGPQPADPPLEPTNRECIVIGDDGLRATLADALPRILAYAEDVTNGRFDIRIGYILPDGLLLSGLESIPVQPVEEDGAPAALNKRYTVLFHWSVRLLGNRSASVNDWSHLVGELQPRVDAGDGAGVVWLEQDDPDDDSRYERAYHTLMTGPEAAISLGIEHSPGVPLNMRLESIKQCLRSGVPCLFWLHQPEADDEARALRERIGAAFERLVPRSAPLTLLREQRAAKRQQQLGVNHIVWDLPSYLPAHNPNQSLFEDFT